MKKENKTRVCPVEMAGGLDNFFRRIFQNPKKILRSHIKEEMKVLDLGCGPGFFTLEIARMLNNKGKVIAADLQEGMLNIVRGKIQDSGLENIIELHKSATDEIGIKEKVDFVFAFYVVHEIPDKDNLFREINLMLAENGKFYIVEPLFHVSKSEFKVMIDKLRSFGFVVIEKPGLLFSRAVLMRKTGDI